MRDDQVLTLLISRSGSTRAVMAAELLAHIDKRRYFHPIPAAVEPVKHINEDVVEFLETRLNITIDIESPISAKSIRRDLDYVFMLSDAEVTTPSILRSVTAHWHFVDITKFDEYENSSYKLHLIQFVSRQMDNRFRNFINLYGNPEWHTIGIRQKTDILTNIHRYCLQSEVRSLNGGKSETRPEWEQWLYSKLKMDLEKTNDPVGKQFLSNTGVVSTMRNTERLWVQRHINDLIKQYPGRYIAVVGEEVVASAENVDDLFPQIPLEPEYNSPYIEYVPEQRSTERKWFVY